MERHCHQANSVSGSQVHSSANARSVPALKGAAIKVANYLVVLFR